MAVVNSDDAGVPVGNLSVSDITGITAGRTFDYASTRLPFSVCRRCRRPAQNALQRLNKSIASVTQNNVCGQSNGFSQSW